MKISRFGLITLLLLIPARAWCDEHGLCAEILGSRPVPLTIEYRCPKQFQGFEVELLDSPVRMAAKRALISALETKLAGSWWKAPAEALNNCYAQVSKQEGGPPRIVFGDSELRLVKAEDSCFQTGFDGSALFLLSLKEGRTVVSELKDGYYSRIEESVAFRTQLVAGRRIVEIEMSGEYGMYPVVSKLFFSLDQSSGKAVPENIFMVDGALRNSLFSEGLLSPEEGLPDPLQVLNDTGFAKRFFGYETGGEAQLDESGRTLRKIAYRWNGKYYERSGR